MAGVKEDVTKDAMDDVIAGEDSANLDEAEAVAANEHANVVAGEVAENRQVQQSSTKEEGVEGAVEVLRA